MHTMHTMHTMDAIDFDAASKAWRANKVALANGWFRYKCAHLSRSRGGFCRKEPVPGTVLCKFHVRCKN